MKTFESHIAAAPSGTDSHAEQANSHLRQDATPNTGAAHPRTDAAHNTAAAHLPSVHLHDSGSHDSGVLANISSDASQLWQGAAGEVKAHPQGWQHSGEIGLGAGVVAGLAVGGAIAAGVALAPEIAVVGGVALAGAAVGAGLYEASHSYTTGKGANPIKHAGAVAADTGAAVVGGAVGAATGLYGGMAIVDEMATNYWASGAL